MNRQETRTVPCCLRVVTIGWRPEVAEIDGETWASAPICCPLCGASLDPALFGWKLLSVAVAS